MPKVFSFKALVASTNKNTLKDLLNGLASDGRWARAIEGKTKAWLKANGYEHWTTVDAWFTEKEGK